MDPKIDWKTHKDSILLALKKTYLQKRFLYVALVNDTEFTELVKKTVGLSVEEIGLNPGDNIKYFLDRLLDPQFGFYQQEKKLVSNPRVDYDELERVIVSLGTGEVMTLLEFCLLQYDHGRLKNLRAMGITPRNVKKNPLLQSIGFYDILKLVTTDKKLIQDTDRRYIQDKITDWCMPKDASQVGKYFGRYSTFALLWTYASEDVWMESFKKCVEFGDFLGAYILINTGLRPKKTTTSKGEIDYTYEYNADPGPPLPAVKSKKVPSQTAPAQASPTPLEVKLYRFLLENYLLEFKYSGNLVKIDELLEEGVELVESTLQGDEPVMSLENPKRYPARSDFLKFFYQNFSRVRAEHARYVEKKFNLIARCVARVNDPNTAKWYVRHIGLEKTSSSERVEELIEQIVLWAPNELSDFRKWVNKIDPAILQEFPWDESVNRAISKAIRETPELPSKTKVLKDLEPKLRFRVVRTTPSYFGALSELIDPKTTPRLDDISNFVLETFKLCFNPNLDFSPEEYAERFDVMLRTLSGFLPFFPLPKEGNYAPIHSSIETALEKFHIFEESMGVVADDVSAKLFLACAKTFVLFLRDVKFVAPKGSYIEWFVLLCIECAFKGNDTKALAFILEELGRGGSLAHASVTLNYCYIMSMGGSQSMPDSDDYSFMVPALKRLPKKKRDIFITETIFPRVESEEEEYSVHSGDVLVEDEPVETGPPINWGVFKTWAEVTGEIEATRFPRLPQGAADVIVEGFKQCFNKYSFESFETLFAVMWDSSSELTTPKNESFEKILSEFLASVEADPYTITYLQAKKILRYFELTKIEVRGQKCISAFLSGILMEDYQMMNAAYESLSNDAKKGNNLKKPVEFIAMGLQFVIFRICISPLPPKKNITVFDPSSPETAKIESHRSKVLDFLKERMLNWRDVLDVFWVKDAYEDAFLMRDTLFLEFLFDDLGFKLSDATPDRPGIWLLSALDQDDLKFAKFMLPRTPNRKTEVSRCVEKIAVEYTGGRREIAKYLIRMGYLDKSLLAAEFMKKCAEILIWTKEDEVLESLWFATKIIDAVELVESLRELDPPGLSKDEIEKALLSFTEPIIEARRLRRTTIPRTYRNHFDSHDMETLVKYCTKLHGWGALIDYLLTDVDFKFKAIYVDENPRDVVPMLIKAFQNEDISLACVLFEKNRPEADINVEKALNSIGAFEREKIMEKLQVLSPGCYYRIIFFIGIRSVDYSAAEAAIKKGATIKKPQLENLVMKYWPAKTNRSRTSVADDFVLLLKYQTTAVPVLKPKLATENEEIQLALSKRKVEKEDLILVSSDSEHDVEASAQYSAPPPPKAGKEEIHLPPSNVAPEAIEYFVHPPQKAEKEELYLISSDSEADFMEYAAPLSKRKTENLQLESESESEVEK